MQGVTLRGAPFQATLRPGNLTPRRGALTIRAAHHNKQVARESQQPRSAPWVAAAAAAALLLGSPMDAFAISGGKGGLGNDLDFKDMSGKNFSKGQFFKVMMRGTNWEGADLSDARHAQHSPHAVLLRHSAA